jgi:uncharacterized RDD family membrane protein YckC
MERYLWIVSMIFDLQKASIWKRASAFLFDFILFGILAVGFAFLLSAITNYNKYSDTYSQSLEQYEKAYSTSFGYTEDEFNALSKQGQEDYMNAYNALTEDTQAMYSYKMMVNLIMVITSFSILLSYLVLEFIVPNLFKNGQTLGKKIFGIAVMRTNGVKMNNISLFIRTFLGKYAIETMIPVLIVTMILFNSIGIVGPIVIGLILLLQIILMCATKTNSTIHDLLSDTVVVDFASQMIYDTEEDLIEAKKKAAAEKVNKASYY